MAIIQHEKFEEVSTAEKEVFLDSSFLIDVIKELGWPGQKDRNIRAKNFIDRLKTSNCKMWISNLAFQEILWFFIRTSIRREMEALGLEKSVTFSDFKSKYPDKYELSLQKGRETMSIAWKHLKRLGITFCVWPKSIREPGRALQLFKLTIKILHKYNLEPMDAMHIATCIGSGIERIVTQDREFLSQKLISTYTT